VFVARVRGAREKDSVEFSQKASWEVLADTIGYVLTTVEAGSVINVHDGKDEGAIIDWRRLVRAAGLGPFNA
jgi:hypothetical protein